MDVFLLTVFALILLVLAVIYFIFGRRTKKHDPVDSLIHNAEEIKRAIFQNPTELDLNLEMRNEFSDRLDEKFPDAPKDFLFKIHDLRELMEVFQIDEFRKSSVYPTKEEALQWRISDPARYSYYAGYEHLFWLYNNTWRYEFNEIHNIWDQTILEIKNYELNH
ncbi:MAG: hypothetical protein GC193_09040 [Cryomorphaceae bacterium]|nr:hypothetical protein [Cryomorphaceae bacterium]